jgi:hypothetical protein
MPRPPARYRTRCAGIAGGPAKAPTPLKSTIASLTPLSGCAARRRVSKAPTVRVVQSPASVSVQRDPSRDASKPSAGPVVPLSAAAVMIPPSSRRHLYLGRAQARGRLLDVGESV